MLRKLLAFALLILLGDGVARAQFPYESHTPLTNFGRYQGIGFGPGYHNPTARRIARPTSERHMTPGQKNIAPWKKPVRSSPFHVSDLYPVANSPTRESQSR